MRFAENELLFYTRDESPLLDARRDLTVVLHRPASQRHKHPSLEAQTLVLTEALALTLQGDLLRVFGPSGSRCAIVWLAERPGDLDAAEEERALLSLPLAAEVAHRRVALQVARSWEEVPLAGRVVCSPLAEDDAVPRAAWVRVDEARWALGELRVEVADGAAGAGRPPAGDDHPAGASAEARGAVSGERGGSCPPSSVKELERDGEVVDLRVRGHEGVAALAGEREHLGRGVIGVDVRAHDEGHHQGVLLALVGVLELEHEILDLPGGREAVELHDVSVEKLGGEAGGFGDIHGGGRHTAVEEGVKPPVAHTITRSSASSAACAVTWMSSSSRETASS